MFSNPVSLPSRKVLAERRGAEGQYSAILNISRTNRVHLGAYSSVGPHDGDKPQLLSDRGRRRTRASMQAEMSRRCSRRGCSTASKTAGSNFPLTATDRNETYRGRGPRILLMSTLIVPPPTSSSRSTRYP